LRISGNCPKNVELRKGPKGNAKELKFPLPIPTKCALIINLGIGRNFGKLVANN